MKSFFAFLLAVLLLYSCAGSFQAEQIGTDQNQAVQSRELKAFINSGVEKRLETGKISSNDIAKTAKTYLGTPHCMGGQTKKCTDCSGFIMAVFAEHGISLPHNSEEQARYGEIIWNKTSLQEGDLVFFIKTYSTQSYITHSGIYLGDNTFIHTSTSKGVTITSLDNSWWKDKFIFGTRVF